MKHEFETDINVQEIMAKLIDETEFKGNIITNCGENIQESNLNKLLLRLIQTTPIKNTGYAIHSHRKLIGPLLITLRRLVSSETRRYVDPLVHQQNTVNRLIIETLEHLVKENTELKRENLEIMRILHDYSPKK